MVASAVFTIETTHPAVVTTFSIRIGCLVTRISRAFAGAVGCKSSDDLELGGCKLCCECLDGGGQCNHSCTVGSCCVSESGDGIGGVGLGCCIGDHVIAEVNTCLGGFRLALFLMRKDKLYFECRPRFIVRRKTFPLSAVVDEEAHVDNKVDDAVGNLEGGDGFLAVVSVSYGVFNLLEEEFDGKVGVVGGLHSLFVFR